MIRENPASRGTETSAEVLVGPPGRMESNAGLQQWYRAVTCLRRTDGGRPKGPLRPASALRPLPIISTPTPPHPHPLSASEGIGGARGLGNLVRPESHTSGRGWSRGSVRRLRARPGPQGRWRRDRGSSGEDMLARRRRGGRPATTRPRPAAVSPNSSGTLAAAKSARWPMRFRWSCLGVAGLF